MPSFKIISQPRSIVPPFNAARTFACALSLFLCLTATARSQTSVALIEGVVQDQTGAPIARAEVKLLSNEAVFVAQTTTDADGRFRFPVAATQGLVLSIHAEGFARFESAPGGNETNAPGLVITLRSAPLAEQVTVTATRTEMRLGDTPASIVTLSSAELSTTAAATLDDALRQVPGFSLFRRAGSRTANPTAQGVSLRGTGASGASRAVVLVDGVPLNDPFGGWVYWSRVPRASVSNIETLRGGASHLYGSAALGGVINIFTRKVVAPVLFLEASYGNQQTSDASLYAAGLKSGWGASLSAETFHTDGYIIVDERERGPVDIPANSRNAATRLTLERKLSSNASVFAAASVFGEARSNGTPFQINRTHIRQFTVGGDWLSARAGAFGLRAYGGTQVFDQNFSAVNPARTVETPTRVQRVPAQATGLSVQWSRPIWKRQTFLAGVETREVRGASDEIAYVAGRPTAVVGAGGRERTVGLFFEDILHPAPKLFFTMGARIDRRRNYEASSVTRPFAPTASGTSVAFTDRVETAFSPHLSALYKLTGNLSLYASTSRAFRQPTPNELYRSFRVGDVLTLANENLRAERLTGWETGANFNSFNQKLNLRGAFFWTAIAQPVANVTLTVQPILITRQRQNLGRTRSRGLEIEWDARPSNHWTVSGGYLFVDARVRSFPANTALEGLFIPQVARNQLTFQARYSRPSIITLGFQGRASASQFDDDQNRLRLEKYFTLDAFISRSLTRKVEIFAAFENVFDQRYSTGLTPVRTINPPVLLRLGFRLRLGSR
ncbi:MAG TPA: TonB-dependent receptor [Pyrinomonadaceae bacterium]|nr:TonB-dependent receptor [Pyrinomonadaceae bacterium]